MEFCLLSYLFESCEKKSLNEVNKIKFSVIYQESKLHFLGYNGGLFSGLAAEKCLAASLDLLAAPGLALAPPGNVEL